ncbi:ribosomal RNA small subunit methyltransferase G [Sulfuriferula plumbiphila]|uniref:Ribosomal RNA small subunit methyltransferase G n=1 Tax=Sulfuriferula plumbiphila TaxID=171865 RepID=A0A512L312_9PROT|nr:16S rRNA (guanine(527)-N(7))-methyltransferase RsmG [Sulfuriferula plumbiphila]BBP06071.1 ribosomal RNA small subunit methyltransferase G [Sulfuriferula plumbiphila]GEP28868.1 ribosomal RNA small subunit methyltransferase G [Sulfuriferula plumbiphila]
MTPHQQLEAGASSLGLALDGKQLVRLMQYLGLIQKWNRVHNLTALRDPQKILTHHLLDSLAVLPHVRVNRLLDVGSGAGLPGIPLAIARPDWEITLSDSNHKKSSFQQQAVIELGLSNVRVASGRVEEIKSGQKFDGVISRAFAGVGEFIACTHLLLATAGRWYAMKGVRPDEELAQLPAGVEVERVVPLTVPGLDAQRHLIILKAV